MSPTPKMVLDAVKRSGVKYHLVAGWDNPNIAASGTWNPVGVLEHHTAGTDSLAYVVKNKFYPIRACHFLVSRDGTVHVVYSLKCYHAGLGGPTKVGNVTVPKDQGNGHFYGIEIESLGKSTTYTPAGDGITPAQQVAVGKLTAALLNMMNVPTSAVMNHKTYAPTRKVDTRFTDAFWRAQAQKYRNPPVQYKYRQDKKVYESKMHLGQVNSDSVWNLALALHYQKLLVTPVDDYTQAVKDACKRYQQKQGWTGSNADGIAGPVTVKKLGLVWVND